MNFVKVLFALLFISTLSIDIRTIQFNETYIVKMTISQVEKMLQTEGKEIHFADITDDLPNFETKMVQKITNIPENPRNQEIVKKLLSKLTLPPFQKNIEKLSSFTTRYYTSATGKQAAEWIHSFYTDIINKLPPQRKSLFEVNYFNHSWIQPSVITRIKGKSDEIVIIGAHEDSTASFGAAPGSDDNASGSSTILEVFKAIAESDFIPEKTLEFMNFAAEEVGLRGSRDIANKYKQESKKVHSMINMDMSGFNNGQNTVGIATDYTNPSLNNFLTKLVGEYTKLPKADIRCGYACSDHASFHSAGYRSSHIFEAAPTSNMNRNIHTSRDTIEKLDLPRALEIAKVCLSFAIELSTK